MYAFWIITFLFATLENTVTTQSATSESSPSSNNQPPPRITPIPNLFSGLEGLVLGVDETIHRLTSPESYSNVDQTGDLRRREEMNTRRINYFDRIRQNYENLQKQIQQTIEAPGEIFKVPELVNMNFQNKGQKSLLSLATPFVNLQIRGKATPGKLITDQTQADGALNLPKIELPSTDMSTNLKIGGSSLFPTASDKSNIVPDELQKRSGRPSRPSHISNEHISGTTYSGQDDTMLEQPISSNPSDNKGRILGDILFSESTFDSFIRRVLESPVGKTVFDPSISPPTHVVEKVRAITRNPFETPNRVKNQIPQRSTGSKPSMNKHGFNREPQRFPDEHKSSQRSRILLAFTLDGVPLKFKIDPRMRDPLEFLHRRLSTAGVSLYIPVDSIRGTVPVGNNILQLGSGFTASQGNVLYIDLANENQLQSLLRSLKSVKSYH